MGLKGKKQTFIPSQVQSPACPAKAKHSPLPNSESWRNWTLGLDFHPFLLPRRPGRTKANPEALGNNGSQWRKSTVSSNRALSFHPFPVTTSFGLFTTSFLTVLTNMPHFSLQWLIHPYCTLYIKKKKNSFCNWGRFPTRKTSPSNGWLIDSPAK